MLIWWATPNPYLSFPAALTLAVFGGIVLVCFMTLLSLFASRTAILSYETLTIQGASTRFYPCKRINSASFSHAEIDGITYRVMVFITSSSNREVVALSDEVDIKSLSQLLREKGVAQVTIAGGEEPVRLNSQTLQRS
jgi:hypothetical protein